MAQVKKSSAPCHTHLLSAMHMMSKMELTSKELEPVKVSRLPTTVISANGSIDTAEEDTVYVKDLDMSVTVQLLEDTPAVLFLGKFCEESGYSYEWKEHQNPHLIKKNGKRAPCTCDNFVPIVVPGLSSEAHLTSSAEDPAETTKELTPKDRETTKTSRSIAGLARMVAIIT